MRLTFNQKMGLIGPYIKKRLSIQLRAVALIVIYLIFFQIIILNIPITDASLVACGIAVVVAGLALFMEGLFLGLMPLGEIIGIKLPQKSGISVILIFAFVLGVGATFAEPAIGVLKAAGVYVKAWEAPLLFVLLNKYAHYLVWAVGAGVGIAVVFGMLRFVFGWSLKPLVCILTTLLLALTIIAFSSPNLQALTGLAWDCGAVTTGPVTVPLVLALGMGICRATSSASKTSAGFGVVTLASLFPILTVFLLGMFFVGEVPAPVNEKRFFSLELRDKSENLFKNREEMIGYAFRYASADSQMALFDGNENVMLSFIERLKNERLLREAVFGRGDTEIMERWAARNGSTKQKIAVFGSPEAVSGSVERYSTGMDAPFRLTQTLMVNLKIAAQAIIPLSILFFLALFGILRERLPKADEVILGIFFAVIGMTLFSIGMDIGLSRIGNSAGSNLPSSFKRISFPDEKKSIANFDKSIIQTAIQPDGNYEKFFILKIKNRHIPVPFEENAYDEINRQYVYTPSKGPLFGRENSPMGFLLVFLFAFIMGYGATLAEPALNALGQTVEELTVGVFKKTSLIQAVSCGVGLGMVVGVCKIIWNIPIMWLLVPPYLLLLAMTLISTEEFVNFAWDSAGVTTGPITVPLVLAMGLGVSKQVSVVEGFGILSMASVFPILTVLLVGLFLTYRNRNLNRQDAGL